ncbi:glycosyltransferase family 2 protein [Planctomycetota bacterium]
MKLSVVIPCYNEVNTIESVIDAVNNCGYADKEIVLVDDCSSDGTRELIAETIESRVDKVIYFESNRGKGAAVRAGFETATGDILIVQDADLEYDPNEIPKVIGPIVDGKADVVYGSRFMCLDPHRVLAHWHRLGNRVLTGISNIFTNIDLTDEATCYKAFRREVIEGIELEEDGFAFCPEITAKIAKAKYRIYEVAISYCGRSYEEGKKIRFRDGVSAVWAIVKYSLFAKKHKGNDKCPANSMLKTGSTIRR